MLLVNNIFYKRNNKQILNDISLTLSPQKIIHLTGNNGVGKTTLLKVLTNILEPEKGEIFWNGKNIKKNYFNFYKDITFIMDKETSSSSLTVNENVLFWKKIFSSPRKKNEIDSILDLLSLNKYKNTLTSYLSYGEKKKLESSRLIIEQKKLWILDDPYIGLDNSSINLMNQTIINHIELGGMVIFTSHLSPDIPNLETLFLDNHEYH
jgi:heme exporter protein A